MAGRTNAAADTLELLALYIDQLVLDQGSTTLAWLLTLQHDPPQALFSEAVAAQPFSPLFSNLGALGDPPEEVAAPAGPRPAPQPPPAEPPLAKSSAHRRRSELGRLGWPRSLPTRRSCTWRPPLRASCQALCPTWLRPCYRTARPSWARSAI